MPEMLRLILVDGLLAAIAAIGFAVISNPSRKAIFVSALLAAVGHALRFTLIKSGLEISLATFVAATFIGLFTAMLILGLEKL